MNNQAAENAADMSELSGKYLTFHLGDEGYGLEILKVQEIIGMLEITKIPQTPNYVKGVINLRGKVIPVIDLRLKFGMPEQELTRKTCIIVVQVQKSDTALIIGIVVDEVSEVLNISGEQIEAAPSLGMQVNTHFILGMAKTESAVKILLDIDKVLSAEEMNALTRASG
ncbi:purine-binding chemotaxis protein CheW [Desulfosalsimonas propionicica]|uniref:Chemotaxis protein CheW n=1 Tax=Desulfosalsimonas propionicica TaxID=332175 RepID=A0A7W0HL55_9BACT|nr:chemotaxis protein CheW [Desulfosalsimonas propionicica]MBA2881766.1 purine-binding chemotaxis protein CheW [Desulfosalsimonas propionicica]